MKSKFKGWDEVARKLLATANEQQQMALKSGEISCRLNFGQQASILAIADRLNAHGVVLADEVGMGKTRIAVELARCVVESGGRVAIVVPPGLGYQWQDELRSGRTSSPRILRTFNEYLLAWSQGRQRPWFAEPIVLISQGFTNWRLGEDATQWRWALLPHLYAKWRKSRDARYPRRYSELQFNTKHDRWVRTAAASIFGAISQRSENSAYSALKRIGSDTIWPNALKSINYRRDETVFRSLLENAVGLGLGVFDLVIIDEAHKSRKSDSLFSRLLSGVILTSKDVRRFALTATPIELDIEQWSEPLERIGIDTDSLANVMQTVQLYKEAVGRVNQCPSSEDARQKYKIQANRFQLALSPFMIRRDKREDTTVRKFAEYTSQSSEPYRQESEITVDMGQLSLSWRGAVCAAEALSILTKNTMSNRMNRIRLTLGSGHGISKYLDEARLDPNDLYLEEKEEGVSYEERSPKELETRHKQRAAYWRNSILSNFGSGDDVLFDHPTTQAALKEIEAITTRDEKVLVFGRYVRPMQALVRLLNARAMLRALGAGQPWPESKIHKSEENAVEAAKRQMAIRDSFAEIDLKLKKQYEERERSRDKLRDSILSLVEQGLEYPTTKMRTTNREGTITGGFANRTRHLFVALKNSIDSNSHAVSALESRILVTRALADLLGSDTELPSPLESARAFEHLITALTDRDKGDNSPEPGTIKTDEQDLWPAIEERLRDEYSAHGSRFARLMYGKTEQHTRRVLQLAFNRLKSFPRVLVAQSMVGREGLNLHEACRTVVLLHPEWNPAIVEQQVGRVDRVGSLWSAEVLKAMEANTSIEKLPRIKILPIVFKGTYDEHHWSILRERWNDLRAQLHGEVIPRQTRNSGQVDLTMLKEIESSAPNFSPQKLAGDPEAI